MINVASVNEKNTIKTNIVLLVILLTECFFSRCMVVVGLLEKDNDVYATLAMLLNSFLVIAFLFKNVKSSNVMLILVSSYILRMGYSIYISTMPLVSDMYNYNFSAERFFYTNDARYVNASGINFSVVYMGLFYKIFGIQRLLLQQFHLTLLVFSGYIVYKILKQYSIDDKLMVIPIIFGQASYFLFKNSCNIHRESLVVFEITCSLYFFIQWYESGMKRPMIYCIMFSLGAAALHSGSIGIIAGYIIGFIIYSPKRKKFEISSRTIPAVILVVVVFIAVYFGAFDIFFQRFSGRTFESIIASSENMEGGSAYSIGVNVTNRWQMLLVTPIRMLYFFMSPMPWDWRGLGDVLAFCGSSLVYGYSFVTMFIYIKKRTRRYYDIIVLIMISLLSFGVIFGWGVKNAGTALRHRDKVIMIVITVISLIWSDTNKELIHNRCNVYERIFYRKNR